MSMNGISKGTTKTSSVRRQGHTSGSSVVNSETKGRRSRRPEDTATLGSSTSDLDMFGQMARLKAAATTKSAAATPLAKATQAAENSEAASDADMNLLNETFGTLKPEEQQAIGKGTFYSLAAQSGQHKNPDGTSMTSQQIRGKFASLSPEAKAAEEAKVQEFGQRNPEAMRMAMADASATWAAAQWSGQGGIQEQLDAGKDVPMARQGQIANLYSRGDSYVKNRGEYIDQLSKIHQLGGAEALNGFLNR